MLTCIVKPRSLLMPCCRIRRWPKGFDEQHLRLFGRRS